MKANRAIFAANLTYLRNQKGKSQKQLADELGILEHRVKTWENAIAFPKMTILVQLVDLLCFTDIRTLITQDIRPSKSQL